MKDLKYLFVVPKTRVVKLASPSFNYGRNWCHKTPPEIKDKEGSLQTLVCGFEAAEVATKDYEKKFNAYCMKNEKEFLLLFQKMCVLDYVIRNTDRNMKNLFVKYFSYEPFQIVLTDNGLAFPVKHPKKKPYAWEKLSWAYKPLNQELRQQLLTLFTPTFVHELCEEVKQLFLQDCQHDTYLTDRQIYVLLGQIWNLKDALEANHPPADWVKRKPFLATPRFSRTPPANGTFDDCFRRLPADYSHRGCC
uniref:Phosphatidylinositol 4-kinase type 2 n=1 Tax=Panagrolaimus davidi TaxID=227884 RepID=A0A914PDB3_9BILA